MYIMVGLISAAVFIYLFGDKIQADWKEFVTSDKDFKRINKRLASKSDDEEGDS